jgi:transmembrane sensor
MMRLHPLPRTRGMSPAEIAAHWVVLQDSRDLSAREEAEFAAWCEDPAHADAYRKASGAMTLFDDELVGGDSNLRALRQAALEAEPAPRHRFPPVASMAVAASIAAALVFVGLRHPDVPAGPRSAVPAATRVAASGGAVAPANPLEYRTGVGERRTVKLADGSVVTMNTQTKFSVAFSEHRRIIRLSRGQALFEVFHDASRPFSVEAADRQVTALGTVFEVRVDPGRVKVTLIRGRVVVDRTSEASSSYDGAPIAPTILKPGEQFDAELGAPQKVAAVNVDQQLLWRNGFVEFDDESLGRAVAEINRYSPHPITLSNDGVAALHVSGLYRTGAPDQFIDAVQGILPIEAKATAQGGVELSLAARRAP